MDERAERIGLNEALFREVNERVKAVNARFGEPPETLQLVCECGDDGCIERIEMTLPDYERLRSDPARFAVRPGHELAEVETVVEQHADYVVVRKRPGDARLVAEATDPRS